ncbi:MAG: nucleotide-binding protein [Nitrososphaeraceae archaeon]|nr:nucleotide-binding protein [Nitrososphaeraceae archaeon]
MNNPKNIGVREKFIASAQNSKILARKCNDCNTIMLATILYCEKCHGKKFNLIEYPGKGSVNTFTIHTVPPEGFEDVDSYAWVIFTLDDILLRASGFLPDIKKPSDLPIGSRIKVKGFDEKHGLVLKKL